MVRKDMLVEVARLVGSEDLKFHFTLPRTLQGGFYLILRYLTSFDLSKKPVDKHN